MRRRKTLRLFLLAAALLLLGLGGALAWGTPRLVAVSPADGAVDVPPGATLELTFSRPMQPDSVIGRLSLEPAVAGSYAWQGARLIFTPERPWPAGATVQVKLAAGALAGRFPALPLLRGYAGTFTVRQPRLAFLYPANGPANIFVHNPLTGEIAPLTNVFSGVLDFDVSPDGAAIYYSARNAQDGSDLYRLSLSRQDQAQDGRPTPVFTPPQSVLSCPQAQCRGVRLSPRGDFLAFERTPLAAAGVPALTQVYLLPLIGGGEPFLAGDPAHQTLQPAWSSNGLLAFYDQAAAEFVVVEPMAGGEARVRARFANQTGQPGDWQPGGAAFAAAEIFFLDPQAPSALQNLERLADSHLLLYPLDGGQPRDLTAAEGIEDAAPAFSPDGAYLAFARKYLNVRQWSPGRQLWVLRLSDGQALQLTNDPVYNHYDFAWSPGGERLAFARFDQSALTEPPQVWTIDPQTGRATQILSGGYAPRWIP